MCTPYMLKEGIYANIRIFNYCHLAGRLPFLLHVIGCWTAEDIVSPTFAPARAKLSSMAGFQSKLNMCQHRVVPTLLHCAVKKHNGFYFHSFPPLPFGPSMSQELSTPHRAQHKCCCNMLSGSVTINDNFGKHCLNNSSQSKASGWRDTAGASSTNIHVFPIS